MTRQHLIHAAVQHRLLPLGWMLLVTVVCVSWWLLTGAPT